MLGIKGAREIWLLVIGSTTINKDFKVGIYIRLSREDGDKLESESVSNQRDILHRYIKENGYILIDEYVDDGVSGTTFERPEFKRMISDIEEKRIDMVITKDLSRLGRDYIKTGYYIENYFPENAVRYVSILDGIDTYADENNNDVTPFKAIINDMYAKDISKKIKGVLKEKELKGEYLGSYAPYGYKKSRNQKNKLEIDTNIAYIVRRIFELYSEGNGFQRIATILDKDNIRTPSQYMNMSYQRETWSPKSIKSILINEAYIGNTVQNKCTSISYKIKKKRKKNPEEYIRVENTHEAIISKELFYKVQEIMKNKRNLSATKHDFLFKGLMFCHNCGRKSRVCYRGKTKKIGYIDCSLARGKDAKCKTCNYNYNKFEEKTINKIREICNTYCDKNALKKIYKQYKNNYGNLIEKENFHLNNIVDRITDISKKIDKIYLDSVNGLISKDDYLRYSKGFIEEKDRLKKEKLNTENKIKTLKEKQKNKEDDEEIEKVINQFLKMEKLSKKILYEIVDRVEIDEYKNIYIYFNFSELNIINER